MKLIASSSNPPIGSLITIKSLKLNIPVEWGDSTSFIPEEQVNFTSDVSICRYLSKKFQQLELYGSNVLEMCEVDNWIVSAVGPFSGTCNLKDFFKKLDDHIQFQDKLGRQFLVGNNCSIADYLIWSFLFGNKEWNDLFSSTIDYQYLKNYFLNIAGLDCVQSTMELLPENLRNPALKISRNKAKVKSPAKKVIPAEKKQPSASKDISGQGQNLESLRKEDGKFIDLPGAEMGKVVVRFPPEASGYLHIGHAKAALLNQYYKEAFCGQLIMRFDDTNPAKEKVDFEKVILEDLKSLQITPDKFTHTSDYFDLMLELCEKMLKQGLAYVDDTDPEVMKNEREQRIESNNRNNGTQENLHLWNEMKNGTEIGQKCCVRAKIDMQSPNGCMRDPTIYRCKNEVHPRTGTKYKVYPTYDFACPIVDSIEGVTHCLRTMEYHDRDAQFFWFIDALGLRKPYIWEYSRLNMTNTVLSKRKLTWFVENNIVQGWDDPRMPTVQGILRRGMTVEGLKQFVIAQGSSARVVFMEWDKIWAFNKKVIDPVAPRYTAVEKDKAVLVSISGATVSPTIATKHPKNNDIGEKTVWTSPKVWIDQADAKTLVIGTNVTFINWGNIKIVDIIKDGNGDIKEVKAQTNLSDKDFKKTLKLTWLGETEKAPFIPCYCFYFNHIMNKPILGKEEDFKEFIASDTQAEVLMLGDPELANVKKSEIIQLQRKGFFICDRPYYPPSVHCGKPSPIILFHIPDGHTKEMPSGGLQKFQTEKKSATLSPATPDISSVSSLLEKIKQQGDKVRDLKQNKADKSQIEVEVKVLLALKVEYKTLTGQEWKPGMEPPKTSPLSQQNLDVLSAKITQQGLVVRNLKSEKADKGKVDAEVKILLSLKDEYKKISGQEWKPGAQHPHAVVPAKVAEGNADSILAKINDQGNLVRKLKSEKADKNKVDSEVKILLSLKEEYKKVTGQDWKPGMTATPSTESSKVAPAAVAGNGSNISVKITEQGDLVRRLKSQKAEKGKIDAEVKVLLSLKEEYKKCTGLDWKPGAQTVPSPAAVAVSVNGGNAFDISSKITEQGNLVRKLKSEKADKNKIDAEVKSLLSLKEEYKKITGQDWKPGAQVVPPEARRETSPTISNDAANDLFVKINDQGNLVRKLKSEKADKEIINEEVKKLLSLKADYLALTGQQYSPGGGDQNKNNVQKDNSKNKEPNQKKKKNQEKTEVKPPSGDNVKKVTRLGLEATKEDNLPDWYSQVITKGEMIEYYDVSGCYVLRPWSFAIWETIRDWFDGEIKKLGVKNCYFPMFVSRSVLEKEKAHIADFAPEVAWVTKSGSSDLAEPIAIRPTSETVMYPAYAKWIQSYRDLPIRLNQWNNVVRWEFKHPQPFLRTREFLWQEGHTAFATAEEAHEEVNIILDLYAKVYTDLLAVPVVKGRKTEKEKFAGGDYTLTTEAFISASGRAIQGATSHHLGQNFSKMFEIVYEDPDSQEKKHVYQNSWGMTTRTIGVLIMVHSDNQGLVLPPQVSSIQIVIVACGITVSLSEDDKNSLYQCCNKLEKKLLDVGIRASCDLRENYSPGWKFNHWELKGVPLRIEIGPKDLKTNQITCVRRDDGKKSFIKNDAAVVGQVKSLLDNIQDSLYAKAKSELDSHIKLCKGWSQFCKLLEEKNLLLSPFCGEISCEDNIKQDSARDDQESEAGGPAMGAKGLCIPFDQPADIQPSDVCIHPKCKSKPKYYTLFGRSY